MSRSTRGNLIRGVIRNWDKIHLNVNHLMHDNWVAYFRTWRRRSLFSGRAPTCRSQSNVWNSQRLLHVIPKFETKILRSVIFAQVNLISVAPNAPKFEDRSQEETEWQEQGAREAAWKLAKSVLKLKEHQRTAFFSPSENRCLPASTLKPEEREFVVDSGASMHMISKKGLEWSWNGYFDEIVQSYDSHNRQWRSANAWRGNCVCQRIGYILDYEVLDNTPAVLSLGKLCDENGYSYVRMDQWSKTTSH